MTAGSAAVIRSLAAVALALVVLFPGEARSQSQDQANLVAPIHVGSKVRLLAPTAIQRRIQGTVMEMDEKSLLLSTEDHIPLRVSRQAITQIEVGVGRRRHTREGLIIGAVFGAILGAVVPLESDAYCSRGERPITGSCSLGITRGEFIASGVVGYAAAGAALGQWAIKTDRWSSVPLNQVRISLAPTRGHGLGLSLALRF